MLKDLIKNASRIHTRDLNFTTYPVSDTDVIVHGELKDMRHVSIFHVTGVVKDPGPIHHISFTCRLAPNPLRIVKAEAEMLTVPLEECQDCLDRVSLLEGMEIKSGFSDAVDQIMGRTKGCTHLCHLIKTMAQEMVHGWMTWNRRKTEDHPRRPTSLKESQYLINSCRVWKEGGTRMRQLAKDLKKIDPKGMAPDTPGE